MIHHVLIIADIEGSSGCFDYQGSRFLTRKWAAAARDMSLDADAVVRALYEAGVGLVTIKDFHRTGYNLLPELIDPRARIVHGYRKGPVPGLGDPAGAEAVMFIGLHAPSGSNGFLAHTLTSRISRLEVNGCLMSEVELFSASLAPYGVRPLFFSGCPEACRHAESAIPGLLCHPIEKFGGRDRFKPERWRQSLAEAAVRALDARTAPYKPNGPFSAIVVMRDGAGVAARIGRRWNLAVEGAGVHVNAEDIHDLYMKLVRLAYLTPLTDRYAEVSLAAYNVMGRFGLGWVRRKLGLGEV